MAFDINEFHAQISKSGGFAKQSTFDIFIGAPPALEDDLDVDRMLTFRISSAEMPGRSAAPTDYQLYGAPYRIATRATYTDTSMTVQLSPDMRERDFFMKWQDLAVGRHRVAPSSTGERKKEFDIGYFDSYTSGMIIINQYTTSNADSPTHQIFLRDAYPSFISPVDNDWSSNDNATMTVSFSYRYFTEYIYELSEQESERRTSLLSRINQSGLGGAIGTGVGVLIGAL